MGLTNLPEWARKKPDEDPLETAVRKQVDRISAAIADTTDKVFDVSKEGDRVLVSMSSKGENAAVAGNTLFTVSKVDNDEYLVMDADARPTDRPVFVGTLSETLESVQNEILYTYLESWERPEPSALADDTADDIEVRPLTDEELDRLFNPPGDKPPQPPGAN